MCFIVLAPGLVVKAEFIGLRSPRFVSREGQIFVLNRIHDGCSGITSYEAQGRGLLYIMGTSFSVMFDLK